MTSFASAALGFAAEPRPAQPAPATAHVTYVAATSAYVDAGQDEGLLEGDALEVVRDGKVVATLKVIYVSSHRVSCSILGSTTALAVGDLVRYTPGAQAAAASPAAESPSGSRKPRGSGLHGRAGLRYLGVIDRSGNDGGYREPAVDLRFTGRRLNGSPVDLDVDIRARRSSYSTFAGGSQTTQRIRAYSCSVAYRFGPKDRLTFGRQYAPMLDGVEIFDGLLYDNDGPRWGGGVLAGFQPDLADLSFSTDVHEYGGFFRVHNLPGATSRWEFTTGIVGSYAKSEVNREYLFLQAVYFSRWFSMYVTQDVDFNRGWKSDVAGLDAVEPTGSFVSIRVHAAKWLDLTGGYDDRKNVYLYRDFVSPLTVFDDTHRQGDWAGASFRFGGHVGLDVEARQADGGVPGPANSYSLNIGAERFTHANFGVRLRGTHFSNLESKGELYALSTGVSVASGVHLEVSGGRLDETNVDPAIDRQLTWYGLELNAAIGRRWYILFSVQRDRGNFEEQDQVYASVMYRF
jgi:hypothetical protein